ncbi:MAG: hypothetical protein C4520_07635 [Candidatus Abyssobacteria bacterium SURF_5]|uniref:Right handed beta helix domain-containing protein n=1 Tax=Abyssobacteria bacterium (strain SURF_5) TaxID=2093360 RepID=A0A3A4NR14_ABYX5|nr:MAG: hypothetical protein C4520_07635 [Candidatus Abyssubacteria bacterium SURF_5]
MKKAFALVFILFCSMPLNALADTFNVSTVAQLEGALTAAGANGTNDSILLAAGTYTVTGSLAYMPAASENKSIVIRGAGAGSSILDFGGVTGGLAVYLADLTDDSSAHVLVRGITFQHAIEGSFYGGLYVETKLANVTVEGCEFRNNTSGYGGGAYFDTAGGTISIANCVFVDNTAQFGVGGGTLVDSGGGPIVLSNNIFSGNWAEEDGGGAYLYTLNDSITVTNNSFAGNYTHDRGAGLFVWMAWEPGCAGYIYNTISRGNSGALYGGRDIYINDTKDDITGYPVYLYNNDFSIFDTNCESRLGCTPQIVAAGNIDADPLFLNAAADDLHLTDASPCRDAGTNSAPWLLAKDFEKDARIINGTVDIGADEFALSIFPLADIKANGSDGPLTVSSGTRITVTVSLDAGAYGGDSADWWLLAETPKGPVRYDYATKSWVAGTAPSHQGQLADLNPVQVLDTTNLPPGLYAIQFGVDLVMNGVFDSDQFHGDILSLEVTD